MVLAHDKGISKYSLKKYMIARNDCNMQFLWCCSRFSQQQLVQRLYMNANYFKTGTILKVFLFRNAHWLLCFAMMAAAFV